MNKSKTAIKTWGTVACIGLAVFFFVTTSLMPMGLLPDIAAGLGETEAFTGFLVTGYAWSVALLTLPLTMLTAHCERRKLISIILLIFVLGHLVAALAPNFATLMAARIITAVAHAIMWSTSAPTAVRLAPPEKYAAALAVMGAAVSMATVLGVPLGTLLGQWFGWRAAFLVVGLLALALFFILLKILPEMASANPRPLKNLKPLLRRPALQKIYLALFLTLTGHAAVFTYFNPFMRHIGGFSHHEVAYLLLLFGLAGIAGNIGASKFAPQRSRAALNLILACFCSIFWLAGPSTQAGPVLAVIFCIIWGLCVAGTGLIYQTALFKNAPEATDLAMSIYAISFNLGLGGGAAIGSRLFSTLGIGWVAYGGAVCISLALMINILPTLKKRKKV